MERKNSRKRGRPVFDPINFTADELERREENAKAKRSARNKRYKENLKVRIANGEENINIQKCSQYYKSERGKIVRYLQNQRAKRKLRIAKQTNESSIISSEINVCGLVQPVQTAL